MSNGILLPCLCFIQTARKQAVNGQVQVNVIVYGAAISACILDPQLIGDWSISQSNFLQRNRIRSTSILLLFWLSTTLKVNGLFGVLLCSRCGDIWCYHPFARGCLLPYHLRARSRRWEKRQKGIHLSTQSDSISLYRMAVYGESCGNGHMVWMTKWYKISFSGFLIIWRSLEIIGDSWWKIAQIVKFNLVSPRYIPQTNKPKFILQCECAYSISIYIII